MAKGLFTSNYRFVFIALVAVWPLLSLANGVLVMTDTFVDAYGGLKLIDIDRRPPYDSIIAEAPDAVGWRKGDRFSAAALSLYDRLRLYSYEDAREGAYLDVTVLRGEQTVRLHIPAVSVPLEKNFPNYRLSEAAALVALAVAFVLPLVLVALRPSPVTWAYYLYGALSAVGTLDYLHLPGLVHFVADTLSYALAPFALVFLAGFAARFPDGRISASGRRIVAIVAAVAAFMGVFAATRNSAGILYSISAAPGFLISDDANAFGNVIDAVGFALAYALSFVALGLHYRVLQPADRAKIRWVVFALAVYVAAALAGTVVGHFVPYHIEMRTSDAILFAVRVGSALVLQAAIFYAVLRHRVFDLRFALNRALAYAVLTAVFVLLLELLDVYVSHQLVESKIATFVEILIALAFAFGLDTAKQQVERFLGATLFRSRERALAALQNLAKSVRFARRPETIDGILTLEVVDALKLTSASAFRADEGVFRRCDASNWPDGTATEVEADSMLALQLASSREPVQMHAALARNLALPLGELQPVLAIPLIAGDRLSGFAMFGAHRDGDDLDPDEVEALHTLAEAAAGTYEHLETEALRSEVAALRARLHPPS